MNIESWALGNIVVLDTDAVENGDKGLGRGNFLTCGYPRSIGLGRGYTCSYNRSDTKQYGSPLEDEFGNAVGGISKD